MASSLVFLWLISLFRRLGLFLFFLAALATAALGMWASVRCRFSPSHPQPPH